jgi:hypothetical protein
MTTGAAVRTLFFFLMAAAAMSFLLCIAADLRISLGFEQTIAELGWAVTWLAGHGLHGAVVVLLPVAYLLTQRSRPKAEA